MIRTREYCIEALASDPKFRNLDPAFIDEFVKWINTENPVFAQIQLDLNALFLRMILNG